MDEQFIAPEWYSGMTARTKQDLMFASGFYLFEHLPEEFTSWSEEELDEWLVLHAWEPFQDYDAEFLWQQITALNDGMQNWYDGKTTNDGLRHTPQPTDEYPLGFCAEDVQQVFDVTDEEAQDFLRKIKSKMHTRLVELGSEILEEAGFDAGLNKKEESHG